MTAQYNNPIPVQESVEFTLEDAYDMINDIKKEREQEIEGLLDAVSNNEVITLRETTTNEVIAKKQQILIESLLKRIQLDVPKDYPIPNTPDLYADLMRKMDDEIQHLQERMHAMTEHLKDIKKNISYLESKKIGLQNMKEAYLLAMENVASKTYEEEVRVTNNLLKLVKKDLHTVVNTIFPDNEEFLEMLACLAAAYTRGGDDLYINIFPETLQYAKFLVEADIAVYHRNDKSKIRLTDLL
ncbi:uncharacterized protein LOC107270503 [Cephus cinctus]|uniref:Uncharacterized protein LOC107270503 n=1 Tax=Cephus cinctus TaxID=211228 RepID=A0AAJ7RMS5_CEPCN|nr:uncharacterized protein LOC107270503 [Cephus cinctus]XP_024943811.1 uncharacterized protein LOC107270503 [Cephus cinctus]